MNVKERHVDPTPPMVTAERGGVSAAAKLVLELATDMQEIEGRELDLDGKTWLVTTEADIAAWLAWHVHSPDPDTPTRDATGNPQEVCLCGETFRGGDWTDVTDAIDRHRAEKTAELVAAAKARRD
ncbi:hypothetical protein [Micromonospora sp. NPDC005652]|uniref:hypothetical protein n=1 Tax=Micromonospora sp. NPDC005652 TaxID=3157046 RepID=UPI0033E22D2B